jgi:hypothetical protein
VVWEPDRRESIAARPSGSRPKAEATARRQ